MHDRKGLSSRCPARRPLLTGGSLMRSDSFHNRHQWPLKRSLISQEAPNLTVPRVVSLLLRHVSAVLDAVFGRFHRLSSFPNLRLNLRPAEVRPFPPSSAMFLGHVMHPHSKRLLRGLMSLRRRSHGPADVMPQVWRCHCSPERHHSEKCSLVTSCREAIYPHSSYEITTLATLLPNSNSCTESVSETNLESGTLRVCGKHSAILVGSSVLRRWGSGGEEGAGCPAVFQDTS